MQWQPFFFQFLPNKTSLGFIFASIALALAGGAALAPRFLSKIKSDNDKKVLIIGHRATQCALEHLLKGIPLEEVITTPWKWQPGWIYKMEDENRKGMRDNDH